MVQSPNYPNGYPEVRTCVWEITAPVGQQIRLVIKDLEIEDGGVDCNYDYLEVRLVFSIKFFFNILSIFQEIDGKF